MFEIDVTGVTPNLGGFHLVDHVPARLPFLAITDPIGTPTEPPGPVIGPADATVPNVTSSGAGTFSLQLTFQVNATAACGSTITNSATFPLSADATADVQVVRGP